MTQRISPAGIDFIAQWEGLELSAYRDIAGVWTIGHGHTGAQAFAGNRITGLQARELLLRDLWTYEHDIHRLVTKPLQQHQFDALVSWHFNTGALATSTLLKRLNAGHYELVDDEMLRWNKYTDPISGKKLVSKGLSRRRMAEAMLWNHQPPMLQPAGFSPGQLNVEAADIESLARHAAHFVGKLVS